MISEGEQAVGRREAKSPRQESKPRKAAKLAVGEKAKARFSSSHPHGTKAAIHPGADKTDSVTKPHF